MKRVQVIGVAAAVLMFASCNKIKQMLKVSVPMETAEVSFEIPAVDSAGTFAGTGIDVAVNIDSVIKANNQTNTAKNIRSVYLKSCTIELENGDSLTNNFSALQACKAEFSADTKPDWQMLAEISNNPDSVATKLVLPVNSDIELKDYFQATRFSYRISGTARKATTKALKCKATIKYNMEVGL